MRPHLIREPMDVGILRWVTLRPPVDDGRKNGRSIGCAELVARTGCRLCRAAEEVVRES